jgi:hypothetical protein
MPDQSIASNHICRVVCQSMKFIHSAFRETTNGIIHSWDELASDLGEVMQSDAMRPQLRSSTSFPLFISTISAKIIAEH